MPPSRCPGIKNHQHNNNHSRTSQQDFTNKVITLWYRPPELLMGETKYGPEVDIWSAGLILVELVLGKPLFTGKTDMEQLQLIFDLLGTPTSKTWPNFRNLKLVRTGQVKIEKARRNRLRERYQAKINPPALNLTEKLLELDPQKRLTASRALESRYFLSEPRAPDRPEDMGCLLVEGGHFHEFQTKKKRREAKIDAEKARQTALSGGQTDAMAQEHYDATYREIMERAAREGLGGGGGAATASAAAAVDDGEAAAFKRGPAAAGPSDGKERKERVDRPARSNGDDRRRKDDERGTKKKSDGRPSSRGRDREAAATAEGGRSGRDRRDGSKATRREEEEAAEGGRPARAPREGAGSRADGKVRDSDRARPREQAGRNDADRERRRSAGGGGSRTGDNSGRERSAPPPSSSKLQRSETDDRPRKRRSDSEDRHKRKRRESAERRERDDRKGGDRKGAAEGKASSQRHTDDEARASQRGPETGGGSVAETSAAVAPHKGPTKHRAEEGADAADTKGETRKKGRSRDDDGHDSAKARKRLHESSRERDRGERDGRRRSEERERSRHRSREGSEKRDRDSSRKRERRD